MKPINLQNALTLTREIAGKRSSLEYYSKDSSYADSLRREIESRETALAPILDKLTAAIREAEGRSTARTIKASDVIARLIQIEDHLGIPKTRLKGVTVTVNDNAQKFPSAYRYTPESTYFRAEHNGKSWRVTAIYRDTCRNTVASIHLSDDAKAAVLSRASEI